MLACFELVEKLRAGLSRPRCSAPTQAVYSATMMESRSGAVFFETEEIVIVFEPCRRSRLTVATPTTFELLGSPLVEGKFTATGFDELAFTVADAGAPERYRINTE